MVENGGHCHLHSMKGAEFTYTIYVSRRFRLRAWLGVKVLVLGARVATWIMGARPIIRYDDFYADEMEGRGDG